MKEYEWPIRILVFFVSISISFLLPRAHVAAGEVLKIGGTGCALGSMRMLAALYEKKNKGATVEVLASLGSSGGIRALTKGAIDIALSSRPLNEKERELGLIKEVYGRTPFLFATNKDVGIPDITLEQLKSIYEGSSQYWPEGIRVRPILRPLSDSDTVLVRQISPEISKALDEAHAREGMIIGLNDQESASMIEKIPGALGTATLAQIITEEWTVNVLSFEGKEPAVANLLNGTYGLSKTLYIILEKDSPPFTKEFVDFIFSPQGRNILERTGNLALPGKPGR